MIIQMYSLANIDEAVKCAELGVDHIGFAVGKDGIAPAELNYEEATAMRKALPPQTVASALTVYDDVSEILRMAELVQPDILHVSSDLEVVAEDKLLELRRYLNPAIRIMKAIAVGTDRQSIRDVLRFMGYVDLILLDTKVSHVTGIGASGATHDWNISRKIVEVSSKPVILAGGLSAGNVAKAMRQVKPWAVDTFTHTSRSEDITRKDMAKVKAFIDAVREAEERV